MTLKPPVFVICAPRSGTTWLVRALNAHPDVFATELRAFGEHVDLVQDAGAARPRLRITLDRYVDALMQPHQWAPLGESRDAVRDEIFRDVYQAIQSHAMRSSGKCVFVDKLTPYLGTADLAVESIARIFPESKLIMLVRDGRDVAVSGVMHWLTKDLVGDAATEQRKTRRAFFLQGGKVSPERFFTDEEIQEWASLWSQPIDALARQPAANRLVVRYEDMSRDLRGELRRVCDFMGADGRNNVLDKCVKASTFEVMSGGRRRGQDAPGQHVRKGVVGDWRRYFTAADAKAFDALAGRQLIEWGYEPDHAWAMRAPERLPKVA